ncbi:Tetratricopeptide repeat-containing protein [Nocardia amikacinitolerans]|uniref:tetratricopeptide repeat protein n=1 Tax=Nocardia amikacinitolerans TaxID=756689 RepID=UPI00082C4D7A|nr:tetratricopeptide repeat protein [Nocardia amikacinitolerans]MCP2320501.1 Tetratricopeptide repeat-containing protein [Nocardia amikacinitolerans]
MVDEAPPGLELLYEGAAAYQRGEVAEALHIFEHAVDTTSGGVRVSALVNAASMCDELGDHAGAVVRFRSALAEIPEDAVEKRASTLVNYSQALQHLGELDDAQAALEQARALLADNPEFGALRVPCLLSLTAVAFHRAQWVRVIELATETLDVAQRFAPHLAGHPLMNLAGAYFETGRRELGIDFAEQALAAFEAAGDRNALAETQQNLATLYTRVDRFEAAEEPLRASQEYFEQAGLEYRAGVGLRIMGFVAEHRDDVEQAEVLYRRSLFYFEASGAALDVAAVQTRLATVAFKGFRIEEGQQLLAAAFDAYASRGLGLHCAQVDFRHAVLLEALIDTIDSPTPELLALARDVAVPAAIAIDAVRYTLPNGNQRAQWNREIADPAMRLAFRFAYLCGDGPLVADLIETQCAGTTLDVDATDHQPHPQLPLEPLSPIETPASAGESALQLGSALAKVAAAAGLRVAPPPRLAVAPDGHIALAEYIAAAERRYGRAVREERVLTV